MCMYLLSENVVILLKLKKSIVKGLSLPPSLTFPSLSLIVSVFHSPFLSPLSLSLLSAITHFVSNDY